MMNYQDVALVLSILTSCFFSLRLLCGKVVHGYLVGINYSAVGVGSQSGNGIDTESLPEVKMTSLLTISIFAVLPLNFNTTSIIFFANSSAVMYV